MKLIVCLFLSTLLALSNAAASLTVTSSDNPSTSIFPLTFTNGGLTGGAGTAAGTVAASAGSPSGGTTPPSGVTTGNTYGAKYASGIPINQVWALTADSGSPAAGNNIFQLALGPQVFVTVSGAVGGGSAFTAGSAQTSAAGVTTSAQKCGDYYLDCLNGVLYFNLNVPGTASASCTVTINQVQGVYAGVGYATMPPTGALTNIAQAVTAQSKITGPTATYCGSGTVSSNTVLYFAQFYTTAPTSATQCNTDAATLAAALKAKNSAFTGSARLLEENERVLLTSYTVLGGYASGVPTSSSAGTTNTPTSGASAAITSNGGLTSSSASKVALGFSVLVASFIGMTL